MSNILDIGEDPSLDHVFFESYNDSDDSSDDAMEREGHLDNETAGEEDTTDVEDGEQVELKLGITEAQASANYLEAGTEVDEEEDGINLAEHSDLIIPEIDEILDKIVLEKALPYKLSDFQRAAINTPVI